MPGNPSLTAFANLSPPWSLAALDANLVNIATLLKSLNNYSTYLADGGAANAYTVSVAAGTTVSLTAGLIIPFKPANANTGASTLNVNGLGAKSIKMIDGSDPAAGDIPTTGIVTVIYDGTNFVLVNVNPAKFARLTGAAFTGAVSVTGGALTANGALVAAGDVTLSGGQMGGYFQWTSWNPSDLIGTGTNAPSGGAATQNTNFVSSVNSSGTVTATFAKAGKWRCRITLGHTHGNAYTLSLVQASIGGTATRLDSGPAILVICNPPATGNNNGESTSEFVVNATAGQTVTILPKFFLTGSGATSDHAANANACFDYLGA